jgi:3-oxoacyl-[acyl-carrier protein] reductase
MDFSGKNVIITGGASGIGKAVVEGIIAGNGHVILLDLDWEASIKVQEEFGENCVHVYQVDLSNPTETRKVFEQILSETEHIDVLINNADIISTKPFEEITQEEWNRVISIDLTSVYVGISAIYAHMVANGYGRIVNVVSVAAKRGGGLLGSSAYAAAKAGVIGLTKAVAREGARKGIACNAVCPSVTMTPMILRLPDYKQAILKDSVPMGRGADHKEIVNVILFWRPILPVL